MLLSTSLLSLLMAMLSGVAFNVTGRWIYLVGCIFLLLISVVTFEVKY